MSICGISLLDYILFYTLGQYSLNSSSWVHSYNLHNPALYIPMLAPKATVDFGLGI